MHPKNLSDDAVLIFGDLQIGVADLPLTVSEEHLKRSASGLARLGEIFDIPTFVMMIPKSGNDEDPEVIREISDHRSHYKTFVRTTPDSFDHKEFREQVRSTDRRTLIVCGVATEVCVHRLVMSGIANGYTVHVVVDACGGFSHRTEEAAFKRFEAVGAVMSSVASLAGEFAGDFTQSPGSEAVEVIYGLVGTEHARTTSAPQPPG